MAARFEWTSGVVRFYETEAAADARGPYPPGIVSVNRTGPAHAFLFGLHANMTRQMRRELVACLLDQGITHTTDVRHGRWFQRDLQRETDNP
ncbi:hypothetical protein [Niveibacterium sp.]|uniref:hypothetical protein n=1 Tax=Niveibacterium sp. TaxID=2017444 RepID=UPI0035B1C577